MELEIKSPPAALHKAFLRIKPIRADWERFKANFTKLKESINDLESEEFHKNLVIGFLQKIYYDPNYFINTKARTDLVIHNGNSAKSRVGVIIETKKPSNKAEMLSREKVNVKAFHELILYYLRERLTEKNLEIKYVVATNVYEWFVFDAVLFDRLFAQNKELAQQFDDFSAGRLADSKTEFFYKQIAEPFVAAISSPLEFTYFDIRNYKTDGDNKELLSLFKLLSPQHLLKLPFANDSNSLDQGFYNELLHIIGLTEVKNGGKKLIERNKEGFRHKGSLLENAIRQLHSLKKMPRLKNTEHYGHDGEEPFFHVALKLSITWINRILFLKLLEAQLLSYHKGYKAYAFLNMEKIPDYSSLNSLFFEVLACQMEARDSEDVPIFSKVPYLNSSLFEPTELEHEALFINQLRADRKIPVYSQTVLKDGKGQKKVAEMPALEYLFCFLDAYDFGSEGNGAVQEESKTLISAAVLGLIFEKINGYKDGSFFTPGFITMYMCRATVRKAVLQKFQQVKGWQCQTLAELYDKIENRAEANDIINSITICDPAVGSGHFLVSALNEIIAIKSELKILSDREGQRLKEYRCEVVHDELLIIDERGQLFEYQPGYLNGQSQNKSESQRVQEALFHEKQTIIENCLFGVDINPNSVQICRLRLWIELLKHAYNKSPTELETLPNIDINIKCGNSLVSRFALDADLDVALQQSNSTIEAYRSAVVGYKNASEKGQKDEAEKLISHIKENFREFVVQESKVRLQLERKQAELKVLDSGKEIFLMEKKAQQARLKEIGKLRAEVKELKEKLSAELNNVIYQNAFEWRFEFPEVLNNNGDFLGFDVVIGNPPYIQLQKDGGELGHKYAAFDYKSFERTGDIYTLFYERGNQLLVANGHLCFITSNKWMRAGYGKKLRNYLATDTSPKILIDLGKDVFESATVDSNILLLENRPPLAQKDTIEVWSLAENDKIESRLSYRKMDRDLAEVFDKQKKLMPIPLPDEAWAILSQEEFAIKRQIENMGKPLKDWDISINYGIKTGYNEAFIIDEAQREELLKNCKDEQEKQRTKAIIKPILRGRDIKKYQAQWAGLYLINTHSGYSIDKNKVEKIKIEDYPAIKKHLDQHYNKISIRQDKGNTPYNLRHCAYLDEFEKEKIVWEEITDEPRFVYDENNKYAEATAFIMTGKKLKFLLAVLNSKIIFWYFSKCLGADLGSAAFRWKKQYVEEIPIPPLAEGEQGNLTQNTAQLMELKVNEILQLKQANPQADTAKLENEIDQLVYQLYGLSAEQIQIVENSSK